MVASANQLVFCFVTWMENSFCENSVRWSRRRVCLLFVSRFSRFWILHKDWGTERLWKAYDTFLYCGHSIIKFDSFDVKIWNKTRRWITMVAIDIPYKMCVKIKINGFCSKLPKFSFFIVSLPFIVRWQKLLQIRI